MNLFLLKFKFETNFSKSELKFPITNVNSSNLGGISTSCNTAGKAVDFSSYVVIFANILALITGIST